MRLRRRPRYADIAATLALIIAMGGTAYAADKLPANSVDTQAIQAGAVTAAKLHAGSVNSVKVVDGSINGNDIANDAITSTQLATDSVQATEIADNSIDSGEIVDNSLSGTDIADGTLTGADVGSNSVGLADLVGTDISGAISFSFGANSCGNLSLSVSGSTVGQAVLITFTGSVAIPSVMFSPARVVAAGSITVRACNMSSSSVSVSGLGVRIITFG